MSIDKERNLHVAAHNPLSSGKEGNALLKTEAVVWILTILSAILLFGIAALIIQRVYTPDINELMGVAGRQLINPTAARPEPVETVLFWVGFVIFTLGGYLFYALISRLKLPKSLAEGPFFVGLTLVCALASAALIYYDFTAQNPFGKGGGDIPQNSRDYTGISNFDFYFDGLFLGNYLAIYTLLTVPFLAYLFLSGIRKYKWDETKNFKVVTNVAGYGVFCWLLIACMGMSIFSFPYTYENMYNFNAVYYSMSQVYSGAPLLVNGFTNTYGLYPHFLNIIFQITGLSTYSFSVVMAILIGVAFALNFYCMKQMVNNRVILFLGAVAVLYFPFVEFKLVQPFDCNFSAYPIRYIIPSSLLFLAVSYLRKPTKIRYWYTSAIMALFVLWNPEAGILCYLAWFAMNVYRDCFNVEKKVNLKRLLMHIAVAATMIVCVFVCYQFMVRLVYGRSPDMSALFETMTLFGKIGFNLLPMHLVHPWNILALVLISGIIYSASKLYRGQNDNKSCMIFLTTLLGLGYFYYFKGRSHNLQLAQSSGMGFILLTLLGDEFWNIIKRGRIVTLDIFFVLFLFLISFSFLETICNGSKIMDLVYQDEEKKAAQEDMKRVKWNTDFIREHSRPHEKIFVITPMQYQGIYFGGSQRLSAFNPGEMDMFERKDVTRLENSLIATSCNIFIEPGSCNYEYLARPVAAIAANYQYNSVTSSMAMLSKRLVKLPKQAFFNFPYQAIHKKYTDDTIGTRQRIDDAMGMAPLTLPAVFSVEILFNPNLQIYQFATLIGNIKDTNGFIVSNVLNSYDLLFGVNKETVNIPMPADEWVYCVMNVYPEKMEVYTNGVLSKSFALSQPMRQSAGKLFIGNIGVFHYYIGAISEVAVNKKALEALWVAHTWEEIKRHI